MSPHKPDPLSRKVEVDISAILIRTEDLERPGPRHDIEFPKIPGIGADAGTENLPRISSAGWASVAFVIGSCLVGLFYTLSFFENVEYLRRGAHLSDDLIYGRHPKINAASVGGARQKSVLFSSQVHFDQTINLFRETQLSFISGSPALLPLEGLTNSPLFAANNQIAHNSLGSGSSPAHSSGPARSSMSAEMPSSAESANDKRNRVRQSRPKNLMRAQMSIFSARSKISSGRHDLGSAMAGRSNLQPELARLNRHSARGAMTMRSGGGALAAPNCMQMQHGMIAQPGLTAGAGGLNHAGLGGAGHRVGNARR